MTYRVGIDIGSTATKAAVLKGSQLLYSLVIPTGYSSVEAANTVLQRLADEGFTQEECVYVATGYGRISVPFADKTVTEITCHGKGAGYLFGPDCTVIDIGGQDTKSILLKNGRVQDFRMNDKCSAGTGKFLEVMANRLGLTQNELSELAKKGKPTSISSMCTVFAESEIISLIGQGAAREDICNGIVESVVAKVKPLVFKSANNEYVLTGGLCENAYVAERLGSHLDGSILTCPKARFAGAIGAALCLPEDTKPTSKTEPATPANITENDMSIHAQGLAAGAAAGKVADQSAPEQAEPDSAVFAFRTTGDALGFESFCKEQGLPERLIPIPRSITAGCGYAWRAPLTEKQRIVDTAQSLGIPYESVHDVALPHH